VETRNLHDLKICMDAQIPWTLHLLSGHHTQTAMLVSLLSSAPLRLTDILDRAQSWCHLQGRLCRTGSHSSRPTTRSFC
jgi:hypothetical protein